MSHENLGALPPSVDAGQRLRAQEVEARALGVLPLGVPSSFQHWGPYPVAIVRGKDAWLEDVDGRKLLDLTMGFARCARVTSIRP